MKATIIGSLPPDHPIYTEGIWVQPLPKTEPEPEVALETEQDTECLAAKIEEETQDSIES